MLPIIYRSEQDIRRQQINTLKIFNDNVLEICEGLEYQVTFQSGRNELCLHVYLSSDFPNEKPLLKVVPAIAHPWVNAEGEVTSAPGLLNFTIHSDLGRVVQAVIREFERNPPPLLTECPGSNITSPTIPIMDSGRTSPNYGAMTNFSSPSNHSTHFLPTTNHRLIFPDLQKLSLEELEALNRSEDRQQQFINDIASMKEQNKYLDDLIGHVEELAESNLSKRDHLTELKNDVDNKVEEVTKLAFDVESLHAKYQQLSEKYSPTNIKEELRLAAEAAEAESEKIAESFLLGGIDVDKFVTLYTKNRSLCQSRKTKAEKLSQQLDNLLKAGF